MSFLCLLLMFQTHLGADIANSWPPSGRSSVRNTKTASTPLWPRWTPQPMRSRQLKSTVSPLLNSSLLEMSARWVTIKTRTGQQQVCFVWSRASCNTIQGSALADLLTTRRLVVWISQHRLLAPEVSFMALNIAVIYARKPKLAGLCTRFAGARFS